MAQFFIVICHCFSVPFLNSLQSVLCAGWKDRFIGGETGEPTLKNFFQFKLKIISNSIYPCVAGISTTCWDLLNIFPLEKFVLSGLFLFF